MMSGVPWRYTPYAHNSEMHQRKFQCNLLERALTAENWRAREMNRRREARRRRNERQRKEEHRKSLIMNQYSTRQEISVLLASLTSFDSVVAARDAIEKLAPQSPQAAQLAAMITGCSEICLLVGMVEAKKTLFKFVIRCLLRRLLPAEMNRDQGLQNIVILGPPGVGKTSLLRAFAKLCAAGGITRLDHVSFAGRSDMIGQYLGQTAKATEKVVRDALGGLLVIDEVYSFGSPGNRDFYAKEAIDTLTQLIDVHKDDLLVAVAGYEEEVRQCFFAQNQGLERRFLNWITLPAYTPAQLVDIFKGLCVHRNWVIDDAVSAEIIAHGSRLTHNASDMVSLATHIDMQTSQRKWAFAVPLLLPSTSTKSDSYRFGTVEEGPAVKISVDEVRLALQHLLSNRAKLTDCETSVIGMYC